MCAAVMFCSRRVSGGLEGIGRWGSSPGSSRTRGEGDEGRKGEGNGSCRCERVRERRRKRSSGERDGHRGGIEGDGEEALVKGGRERGGSGRLVAALEGDGGRAEREEIEQRLARVRLGSGPALDGPWWAEESMAARWVRPQRPVRLSFPLTLREKK